MLQQDAAEDPFHHQEMPSDAELATEIRQVLRGSDLTKMSLKEVRAELERRFRLSPGALDAFREKLKEIVAAEIAQIQAEQELEDGAEDLEGGEDAAEAAAEAEVEAEAVGSAQRSPKEKRKSKSKEASSAEPRKSGQKRPRDEDNAGAVRPRTGAKSLQASVMTRKEFMKKAKGFAVQIGDRKIQGAPKQFSTGSCGFFGASKVVLKVGDEDLTLQCQINCTVIGSKQWQD
mmetsp:Transcript_87310/g.271259  ORF Transcript_87310/g.271259 Transcript_87310/m.271259 type:complete len:232 (-) Transcript_87310:154-849(-)